MLYLYLIAWARRFRLLGMAVPLLWIGESHACFLYNLFAWDSNYTNTINMENAQTSSLSNISNLIDHAKSVLGLSEEDIRNRFSDTPICLMEYIEKGVHENIIEIRFDKEYATLSCSFDINNKCDYAFLFIDNSDDIDPCINYFNNTYDYDYMRSGWILPNCYLAIKTIDKEFSFMFYKPF